MIGRPPRFSKFRGMGDFIQNLGGLSGVFKIQENGDFIQKTSGVFKISGNGEWGMGDLASFIKAESSLHFWRVGILYLTQRRKGHKGTKKTRPHLIPESINQQMKDAGDFIQKTSGVFKIPGNGGFHSKDLRGFQNSGKWGFHSKPRRSVRGFQNFGFKRPPRFSKFRGMGISFKRPPRFSKFRGMGDFIQKTSEVFKIPGNGGFHSKPRRSGK